MYNIELVSRYARCPGREPIVVNSTTTIVLAPFAIEEGVAWFIGELINDDLSQSLNAQIEESWTEGGPWTVAFFNELQNIAAGEARRFNLTMNAQGPVVRVTATASGAGLNARRSFATGSTELWAPR